MKTLYISDVDGTLYRGGQPMMSEESKELFCKVLQEGAAVTIASGRNLYGIYDLARDCKITLPVIAYNGSAIYDFKEGKALKIFPIENLSVAKLCGMFDGKNLPFKACVFFSEQQRCVTFDQNGYRSDLWIDDAVHPNSGLLYDEPIIGRDSSEILSGECLYIGTYGKREELEPLYQAAKKMPKVQTVFHQSPYDAEKWYVDIGAQEAGKGAAALELKKMLGAQELVTFGDNYNDISMLEEADRSYTVPEAPDQVKSYATAVLNDTPDCVLQWIQQDYREKNK